MKIRCVTNSVIISYVLLFVIISSFLVSFITVSAQTSPEDLQIKIDQRTEDIKKLEIEIASYSKQLAELGGQATSLSATLKSLEITQKKLETDIKVTENKIIEKNLQLRQLGSQIADKEDTISDNRKIIARSYASINELDNRSLPELLLGEKSLSKAWNSLDELSSIQRALFVRIELLQSVKANLEANRKATEKAKVELSALSKQLVDQKKIVMDTANENNTLLKETKNNQATYSKLLVTRQEQKDAFERELFEYESSLNFILDPSSIPSNGKMFSYPLDNVFITQQFGKTSSSGRLYVSGSHNGLDFRASIGTRVKATLSGVVVDIENTNSRKGCQYGYWVLIRHANGLSTLYAHLSLVSVVPGQEVTTGQVIGYSGNTGYSEGPHLHLGVYVTSAIDIVRTGTSKLKSTKACAGIKTVTAHPSAQLNPQLYLP